jgi:small basic protein
VLICLQIIFEERNNAAPGMNKVIVSAVLAFGAQIFIGTADLRAQLIRQPNTYA